MKLFVVGTMNLQLKTEQEKWSTSMSYFTELTLTRRLTTMNYYFIHVIYWSSRSIPCLGFSCHIVRRMEIQPRPESTSVTAVIDSVYI